MLTCVLCLALDTWGRKARPVGGVLETDSILVQGVRRGDGEQGTTHTGLGRASETH